MSQTPEPADTVQAAPSEPGQERVRAEGFGEQQDLPLAFVHGKPLTVMPRDLYIPPDALEVFLEAFEGPLDLLLYLIRRQNLDILEINVAQITEQYIRYVELMGSMQFESSPTGPDAGTPDSCVNSSDGEIGGR